MAHHGDAFRELVTEHGDLLRRRALQLETSGPWADDLVQDTFERALRAFHRFSSGTNAKGWLLTIMNNLFIDACRHRALERSADLKQLAHLCAPDPEEPALWERIGADQLHTAIPRLEPSARELMTLYLSGVRSYRTLSARLGIPENTVGTRLHRARRKLRSLLESWAVAG